MDALLGKIQQCHSVPGFHQHFSSCAEDAFFATTFDGLLRQGLQSLQSLIPATSCPPNDPFLDVFRQLGVLLQFQVVLINQSLVLLGQEFKCEKSGHAYHHRPLHVASINLSVPDAPWSPWPVELLNFHPLAFLALLPSTLPLSLSVPDTCGEDRSYMKPDQVTCNAISDINEGYSIQYTAQLETCLVHMFAKVRQGQAGSFLQVSQWSVVQIKELQQLVLEKSLESRGGWVCRNLWTADQTFTLHVEWQCLAEEAEQLVLPCSQDDLVVNVSNVDPSMDEVLQGCSLEIVNNRSMAAL